VRLPVRNPFPNLHRAQKRPLMPLSVRGQSPLTDLSCDSGSHPSGRALRDHHVMPASNHRRATLGRPPRDALDQHQRRRRTRSECHTTDRSRRTARRCPMADPRVPGKPHARQRNRSDTSSIMADTKGTLMRKRYSESLGRPTSAACVSTPGSSGMGIAGQHAIGRVQGGLPDAELPSQVTASSATSTDSAGETYRASSDSAAYRRL
jgi:hypothetical protein